MKPKRILKQAILAAIILGAYGGAQAHEHGPFHNDTLVAMFEQVNQHYFGGELRNVEVRWANLKSEDARGITRSYGRWSFLIEVDRDTNKTSRATQAVLKHEACHVATYFQIEQEHSDLHGPLFAIVCAVSPLEHPSSVQLLPYGPLDHEQFRVALGRHLEIALLLRPGWAYHGFRIGH